MKPIDIFEISDIREYIKNLSEDDLIENVIIPLYQKRNYCIVSKPSHGPGEHGKDIIFKKNSFPRSIHYNAIQAKAVKIDANNIGKIIDQAKAAFQVPFIDRDLHIKAKADFVEVITSGKVTNDAEIRFYEETRDRRHIMLIDGEQLVELIEKTRMECHKIETSQTTTTSPALEKISTEPHSIDLSVGKSGQLSSVSLDDDIKGLMKRIREGKLPEIDEEIIRITENKISKKIPLEAEKGQLLYQREIIETTRISLIPTLTSQSEYVEEISVKDNLSPSLELSQKLSGILESLSEPERKMVDILHYCDGIDENTLGCLITIEDLDWAVLETLKEKDIIYYKDEKLNLPESFTVEKLRLINEAQQHLEKPSQARMDEISAILIRALNVCNESIPLILSLIDNKYNELAEGIKQELLSYILQNHNDRSVVYFASCLSKKDYSLIEIGEGIISKDIVRYHDHSAYFNFGSALLSKNTKDGIIIDKDIIDKNQIENAKSFLEIACEMDENNAQYIAALSIAYILLGDLNSGIFNAKLALKKNDNEPQALNAISIGYILKNNLNIALPYLKKLCEAKPDIYTNVLNLGSVYKGLRMFDKALEAFEQANHLNPNMDYIIAEIGVAHHNLKNADVALNFFKTAIELNPMCELAWLGKGDIFFNNLGDFQKAVEFYEKAVQINEDNANGWVGLAQSYERLNDHEKARNAIEKAIEKKPSSEYGLLGLGAFYANKGMVEECEKWCGKIIESNPKNSKALECIGVAYHNIEKYEAAIEFFDKALDIDPTQSSIIFEKAVATNALNNVQEAKQLYEDVIKFDSDNIKALLELSKILNDEGNYDKALKHLSHAEKESPDDSDILLAMGAIYANKKDYEKAIECLDQSVNSNPKNVASWLNIGKIYTNTLNSSKAIQYFENGLEIDSDNIMLLEGLGISCLNLRLFDEAIKNFERILKLVPSNFSTYIYIAEAYKLKGEFENSVCYYKKLLELEPNNRSAILGLAGTYISSGNIPSAKNIFKNLMKESGNDPQVPFEIGIIWKKSGDSRKALYYINKSIKTNPNREIFYIEKVNIHLESNNYGAAITSCKKGLKINPNNSTILYQMGIINLAKNDTRKAIEFFEKSSALESENANVWFNLGIAYNNSGDNFRAKECFEFALKYEPFNIQMLSVVGDFYNKVLDDSNMAITCYKKAISLGRDDYRIKIVIATCYLNAEKLDDCIKCCVNILKQEPDNIDALVIESMAWSLKGQYDIPNKKLKTALVLHPDNYSIAFSLAILHYNTKQMQDSIDWAKKCVEKDHHNPNNAILYFIIGNIYNLRGEYKESIANFEYAKKYNPHYLDLLQAGGFPYRNLGRYEEAIEWWEEYLKLKPDDWELWYYTGVTYGDIDDFKNGMEYLQKAISLNDSEKAPYYALAIQYSKSGNHLKAIEIFQKLKILDAESAEPWLLSGDIYFNETNEFEKAVDEYFAAININPNNWKALANLSVAYQILGDSAKGTEYMDKAIQQCPDKIDLFLRNIHVFLRTDRINDAEQLVKNALAEIPENDDLWFLKSCIASINMDVDKSINALEKAINLNHECIPLALKEPSLEYLRKEELFKNLIDKYS